MSEIKNEELYNAIMTLKASDFPIEQREAFEIITTVLEEKLDTRKNISSFADRVKSDLHRKIRGVKEMIIDLRFIERDGKRILQKLVDDEYYNRYWEDVELVSKEISDNEFNAENILRIAQEFKK